MEISNELMGELRSKRPHVKTPQTVGHGQETSQPQTTGQPKAHEEETINTDRNNHGFVCSF